MTRATESMAEVDATDAERTGDATSVDGSPPTEPESATPARNGKPRERGKTVHGEAANAGHRVLAPDDAEVEAYLETALNAPPPERRDAGPASAATTSGPVAVLDFGSQF